MSEVLTSNQGSRTLPHNLDAERGVLGSMLLSTDAQDDAFDTLTSKDFYRPSHRVIFDAMAELNARSIKFDHISLNDKLVSSDQLAAAGGADYLADLTLSVPATSHYKRYADIVKKLSTYRRLVYAGTEIASLGFSTPEDEEKAVAQAERRLFDVTEEAVSSDFQHIGKHGTLVSAMSLLHELASAKGGIVGVKTGFNDLDLTTRGFKGGQFIVLGARPGVGKTALALNMAVGAALDSGTGPNVEPGATVGIFSLEMTAEDLAVRLLTSRAGVSMQQLQGRGGNVEMAVWDNLQRAGTELSNLPIHIDASPDLDINRLRVKAKRLFRDVGDGKRLIILDYLQLMKGDSSSRQSERYNEVREISRSLKILAKDLDTPILALSQLTRPSKGQRDDRRPQLSDIRDSGAIEQDADIVLFLQRGSDPHAEDEEEGREHMSADAAKLIIAKHRNGPTRDIHLSFDQQFARFRPTDFRQP